MSVFSRIKGFFSRNRNKFVIGGLIISGTIFLTRYAQQRIMEWHEKEAMEFIERNRKQSHFEIINRTCNQTILNLSNTLLDSIYEILNTDEIIEKLKENPKNKVELWETLKTQVFTKAGCVVYSIVMLVITLKLQMNIVGGYLYKAPNSVSAHLQEKYLSLSQEFFNSGIKDLANIIETEVAKLVKNVDLKKQMKLSDLEAIFWSLQSSLDASEHNPVNRLKDLICPTDPVNAKDIYGKMLRDTADLLESEEVKYLVIHYINNGFMVLGDQLSEFFTQNGSKVTELPSDSSSNDFHNPFINKKPLAKLIPILDRLLIKQSLPQNLIQFLISNEKLQKLCANVYESLLG